MDHFKFLQKSLDSLGYSGQFLAKPDSPCLYLPDNSGPDGCAIFHKEDKFQQLQVHERVIQVWRVESNQVNTEGNLQGDYIETGYHGRGH